MTPTIYHDNFLEAHGYVIEGRMVMVYNRGGMVRKKREGRMVRKGKIQGKKGGVNFSVK